MNKLKIIKNTEQEVCIKIVAGESVDEVNEVTLDFESLCFKPDQETLAISTEGSDRFQEIDPNFPVTVSMICAQWSGQNGNCYCNMYRGVKDFEHKTAVFCVGDTCQLEFDGQEYPSDVEYSTLPLIFEIHGAMTLWVKMRKHGFRNFAGEYATYGAYEDDTKRGAKVVL